MKLSSSVLHFLLTPVAILAGAFISGCGGEKTEAQDSVPAAASNLVQPTDGAAVEMPHKVDTATEFSAALGSVSGGNKPDLRDTGQGSTVVRVEKAPTMTKPGESAATTQKSLERDWDGTVLIPDGTQMSHAHTTDVTFSRIEAHPLKNGSLRVWVRVKNLTGKELDTRVACNFKSASNEALKTAFIPVKIPANDAIDVYFMSPMPNVVSYTILVR